MDKNIQKENFTKDLWLRNKGQLANQSTDQCIQDKIHWAKNFLEKHGYKVSLKADLAIHSRCF